MLQENLQRKFVVGVLFVFKKALTSARKPQAFFATQVVGLNFALLVIQYILLR